MECPICFNLIKESVIGSCTHHFCKFCLIKWCEFGGTNCPTCKTPITHIRSDIEFDRLSGNIGVDPRNEENYIIIKFVKEDKAGITLENYYSYLGLGTRGPGVIITKINENAKCYKEGLRKKDIILAINNIPCVDHKQSIDIINNCWRESTTIICSILNSRRISHID